MFQIKCQNGPKKEPRRDPKINQNGLPERAMFQTLAGGARDPQNLIKQMKNHPRNLSGKKDGKRNAITKCALIWLASSRFELL